MHGSSPPDSARAPVLREIRCVGCRRLLGKTDGGGIVAIVCRDCKTLTVARSTRA